VAVASGKLGYVFMHGKQLLAWGASKKAAKSPEAAALQVQAWINQFQPEVLVSEKPQTSSRKGRRTHQLMQAICNTAAYNTLLDVCFARTQEHENKYVEAAALTETYPELRPALPRKRRLWETEPRSMIYFEALALALHLLDGKPPQTAST
jgi:hypothetical protein